MKDKKNDFYQQDNPPSSGLLLINLGSPQALTRRVIRRYLAEFLSDRRVIEIPRLLWWFILHLFILPFRPAMLIKKYQPIWLKDGSPLLVYSQRLANKIQQRLPPNAILVHLAMRYGQPSIQQALQELEKKRLQHLTILPLYPQYSATTTASCFDAITNALQQWRYLPSLTFIHGYADHPRYIEMLAQQVRHHWQHHTRGEKLLISFHGLPKRNVMLGDPYDFYCHKTARLLAQTLELTDDQYELVFQSRFGKAQWLQPYCETRLRELAQHGVKSLDIICPGFPIDCLETLEEIALTYRDHFLAAGGETLHYIPALNDADAHADLLITLGVPPE